MKFNVKAWSKGGRAGVLQVGTCSIETPALLINTRKGLPTFISPDLLSSLPTPDSRLLQFSPLHFSEGISLKTISDLGGLHGMLGLHEHVFAAIPRDSVISLPEFQSSNKMGASFETPCGRLLIKPLKYMEMISSMKPDMWVTLADEVPAWVSEKRNRASVDRTVRWLDDCLTSSSANSTGFCLAGFGLGESMDQRPSLLSAITEILSEDKPRQICGLGLPEEVLQGVAAGIDLFDSTYIYHLTLGGFALAFPLEEMGRHGHDCGDQLCDTGSDGTKINLKATIYSRDASPILDGCNCYTCQNHTKAYINHLFNVHEMLAQILLEIHNTHHYLGFFRAIREAIKGGSFEEFCLNFVETRRGHILAAALSP
ncbi:hypothetical protein OROHE_001862 [Orobanche hederae]